jgi:hypothetical protein
VKIRKRAMVFENGVLRKTFWPERDDLTGEWREMHIAKGHDLYCSPDITRVIKRWKMRWTRLVALVVGRDCIHGFVERIYKKKYLEERQIDRWVRLKCIYLSTRTYSETRWNRLILHFYNAGYKEE